MQVKVLGAGCANCHALEERANEALVQLGAEGAVELVTDYTLSKYVPEAPIRLGNLLMVGGILISAGVEHITAFACPGLIDKDIAGFTKVANAMLDQGIV